MSFGFAIGDFVAVGQLAFKLYRDCFKVAKGAPQEFQVLKGELSNLHNALKILEEEVKNPESVLIKAGEDRVRMVNEMVSNVGVTLKKLEKVAAKFGNPRRRFKGEKDVGKVQVVGRLFRHRLAEKQGIFHLLCSEIDLCGLLDIVGLSQWDDKSPFNVYRQVCCFLTRNNICTI
jgi:hypothetical protein